MPKPLTLTLKRLPNLEEDGILNVTIEDQDQIEKLEGERKNKKGKDKEKERKENYNMSGLYKLDFTDPELLCVRSLKGRSMFEYSMK